MNVFTYTCSTLTLSGFFIPKIPLGIFKKLHLKIRRPWTIVDKLITIIRKDYPKSSDNKIAALTSLRYNCERCYLRVTSKVKKGEPKIEYWKNGAGGRQLKGLLKRREEEVRLFLK